jgi:DNA-binding beta-propeller fold protein YncE
VAVGLSGGAILAAPVTVRAEGPMIFRVAGSPLAEGLGDGGPATMAEVGPYDVASTPDCGFLIADGYNARVRRVSPHGMIMTIAGTGTAGFGGDGGPAIAARFQYPRGVAAMPDDGVLIADEYNRRVRRVFPDGTIRTVAGDGIAGYTGDGGQARAAELGLPVSVAVTPDGGYLIADALNERVRKVAADGVITTVAGTGTPGVSGDGGPATAAQIGFPVAVAAAPDGGFLVADQYGEVVRRISVGGTITTLAGTGRPGLTGDGGPATAARIDYPRGMAPVADGGTLIADQGNKRVRRVWPNGMITTLADTRMFGGPRGLAVTPDGGVLIATVHGVEFIDAHLPRPRLTGMQTRCRRLLLAITRAPRMVGAGRRMIVAFQLSLPGRVRLMVRRARGGDHMVRVGMRMMHGRHGRNRIALRAPMRPGHYRLDLRARTVDGKHAAAMFALQVVRSRH